MLESVAVISFQAYLFSSLFCLLALHFFLRSGGGKSPVNYLPFGVFCLMAFFTKENAIVLPAVCLAYIFICNRQNFGKNEYQNLNFWVRFKPFIVALALCVFAGLFFLFFWLPRFPKQIFSSIFPNISGASTPVMTFYAYINSIFLSLLHNIKTLLFPFRLSADYSIFVPSNALSVSGIITAVLCAGAAVWLILKVKNPLIKFLTLFAIIVYLPVSNIVPLINTVNDRYLYFLMVPAALLCAAVLDILRKQNLQIYKYAVVMIMVMIFIWAFSYRARGAVFFDNSTVYAEVVRRHPQNVRGFYNLAISYMISGNHQKALENFQRVQALNPAFNSAEVFFLKGRIYMHLGNIERARQNTLSSILFSRSGEHIGYFFNLFETPDDAMLHIINIFENAVIEKNTLLYFIAYYKSLPDGSKFQIEILRNIVDN